MSINSTVLVIGGDRRLSFLAEELTKSFRKVIAYTVPDQSIEKAFSLADIIVAPVPFSRDRIHVFSEEQEKVTIQDFCRYLCPGQTLYAGNIPEEVQLEAVRKNITCRDFLKMEWVETENALATAEGAVAQAIALSVNNLHAGKCMVLGYGRCGKAIAKLLKQWQIDTTVAARRESVLTAAEEEGYHTVLLENISGKIADMRFIFNTIPSMVLTEGLIGVLEKDAVIIDIASAPGGTDFAACERAGITAVLSLGIPGRYSPKTSAEILLDAILMEREEVV
ncbi:MAG: dipicolinate synthase [Clostridiales bacterium]|nr:dipicolinate synthase [Clostridiales bacterium]